MGERRPRRSVKQRTGHASPITDHSLRVAYGVDQGFSSTDEGCGEVCLLLWDDSLRSRHHLAVGADFGSGGLTARGAGVEDGPVFLRHGRCSGLLLLLLVQESPIERLLGARRFGLQTVQDLFVLERLGALRHGTFFDDVVDPIQDRIGCQFPFREPVEAL